MGVTAYCVALVLLYFCNSIDFLVFLDVANQRRRKDLRLGPCVKYGKGMADWHVGLESPWPTATTVCDCSARGVKMEGYGKAWEVWDVWGRMSGLDYFSIRLPSVLSFADVSWVPVRLPTTNLRCMARALGGETYGSSDSEHFSHL
ncbi:hypothetical protein B0J14DRAFT_175871 [Halenospora varia]|nr:hypothetical protein B0J14DRAFT_175871 [Halenospora varia]